MMDWIDDCGEDIGVKENPYVSGCCALVWFIIGFITLAAELNDGGVGDSNWILMSLFFVIGGIFLIMCCLQISLICAEPPDRISPSLPELHIRAIETAHRMLDRDEEQGIGNDVTNTKSTENESKSKCTTPPAMPTPSAPFADEDIPIVTAYPIPESDKVERIPIDP